ncbi:AAA family ATPase [Actinomadura madurae]|uniref:AAA family ATPase n=1 Tax=Actinomadura madurae TaxID=1993 RepID=UPI00202718EF|nr:AAA family ATPase [Actinomadura madurae]URN09588.1 AAA family ATPase [Actinomadura madurae]
MGKTSLARALAASLGVSCGRIQFTPDLLPSDVTGVSIFNQRTREFEFRPGPVFAPIVLADEINRASPKVQSALLEVMEERQVTVDGTSHPVGSPFMVIATQNPVEMDGTYALPESQLDRFTMRVSVGYPDSGNEVEVLRAHGGDRAAQEGPVPGGSAPRAGDEVIDLITQALRIHVGEPLYEYLVSLVSATRNLPELRLGASPRAGIAWLRVARVRAAAAGRDFVTPQDLWGVAEPVLAHRLLLTDRARADGVSTAELVRRILDATPVPDGS